MPPKQEKSLPSRLPKTTKPLPMVAAQPGAQVKKDKKWSITNWSRFSWFGTAPTEAYTDPESGKKYIQPDSSRLINKIGMPIVSQGKYDTVVLVEKKIIENQNQEKTLCDVLLLAKSKDQIKFELKQKKQQKAESENYAFQKHVFIKYGNIAQSVATDSGYESVECYCTTEQLIKLGFKADEAENNHVVIFIYKSCDTIKEQPTNVDDNSNLLTTEKIDKTATNNRDLQPTSSAILQQIVAPVGQQYESPLFVETSQRSSAGQPNKPDAVIIPPQPSSVAQSPSEVPLSPFAQFLNEISDYLENSKITTRWVTTAEQLIKFLEETSVYSSYVADLTVEHMEAYMKYHLLTIADMVRYGARNKSDIYNAMMHIIVMIDKELGKKPGDLEATQKAERMYVETNIRINKQSFSEKSDQTKNILLHIKNINIKRKFYYELTKDASFSILNPNDEIISKKGKAYTKKEVQGFITVSEQILIVLEKMAKDELITTDEHDKLKKLDTLEKDPLIVNYQNIKRLSYRPS